MHSGSDFLDRVRADLAASRRRRLGELAVRKGRLTASRLEEIMRAADPGRTLEELLVKEGALTASDVELLARELDDPSVSRFDVGEKLGEGAVSVVHRGTDRELGRPVALKFLRESYLAQEKVRERFHREAQSLARMDHPNVVKVHDVGRDGERLFLVMELVEGGSLGAALRREPPGARGPIALLEQAARGVQHAHERGVVHRDLKPENILVSREGTAKVADFGLARLAESGPALTHTGTVLGTPLYMAPEQVLGRGKVTERTDVYALGAILYQALSGRPPHEAEHVTEVYDKILHEDPVPPRRLIPTVPWELEAVALKAMEKEPGRRYASAGAFADDLRRFLAGEPVEARPVSSMARAWRRVARHRTALLGALLLMALLAGAGVLRHRGGVRAEEALAQAGRLESEGRLQTARDAYLVALGLDASSSEARAGAERTDLALGKARNALEAARGHLEKARAALYDERIELVALEGFVRSARDLVEPALAAARDLPLAHSRMGEVWEFMGFFHKAEACFRTAAALDPGSGPTRYRLGRLLLWRAYLVSLNMWTVPDPAETAAAEAIARDGAREIEAARSEGSGLDDELSRTVASAMIAYLRGDPGETRRLCDEGIRSFGRREGVEELHWLDGLSRGKRADKIPCYNAALALRPRFPLALYSRAWALPAVGKGIEATADFDAAIRCAPGFAEAYIFRGSDQLSRGRYDEARADFDRLIEMGVHLAPAYNGRAGVRLRQKDFEGAISDATEAIRHKPERYHIPWTYRGEARLHLEQHDAAIADATKAIEILRGQEGVAYPLTIRGRARAARGDRAGAIEDLRAAGPAGAPYLKSLGLK